MATEAKQPLTYHMDLSSIREEIGSELPKFKNVAEPERWASMFGGGGLVAYGLSRRDLPGLAIAALGGFLFNRGSSGYCALYNQMNVNTRKNS